jgi:hypothetical protein
VAVRSLQTYQLQAGSNKTRNDLYGKLEWARENQRINRQSPTDAEETRKRNFTKLLFPNLGRTPHGGRYWSSGGRVFCMMAICFEINVGARQYILVGTLLG